MSQEKRRNFLSKTSSAIDNIRKSVTNLAEGLKNAGTASSNILQQTDKSNRFLRTLEKRDGEFFAKRREAALRRQREDELEAASVTGVTKRQGNVLAKSTKGFLGRILDFLGILLIGWALSNLPFLIKKIEGLLKLIKRVVGILSPFLDVIAGFLRTIGNACDNFLNLFRRFDFGSNQARMKETLERGNAGLAALNTDFIEGTNEFITDPDISKAAERAEELEKKEEQREQESDATNQSPDTLNIDDNFVATAFDVDEEGDIEPIVEGGETLSSDDNTMIASEGGSDNIEAAAFTPVTDEDIAREEALDDEEGGDDEEKINKEAGSLVEGMQGIVGELDIKSEPDSELSSGGGAIEGLSQADFNLDSEKNQKSGDKGKVEGVNKDQSKNINPVKKFFRNLRGRKKPKTTIMIVEKNPEGTSSVSPISSRGTSGVNLPSSGKTKEKTLSDIQALTLY